MLSSVVLGLDFPFIIGDGVVGTHCGKPKLIDAHSTLEPNVDLIYLFSTQWVGSNRGVRAVSQGAETTSRKHLWGPGPPKSAGKSKETSWQKCSFSRNQLNFAFFDD